MANGTKKLIYLPGVTDKSKSFRLGRYEFPNVNDPNIPVEVPNMFADLLLKMTDTSCFCHNRPPKILFQEIP